MNTAELMITLLGDEAGVKYIFGVPGGAIEDLNAAIYHNKKGVNPLLPSMSKGPLLWLMAMPVSPVSLESARLLPGQEPQI